MLSYNGRVRDIMWSIVECRVDIWSMVVGRVVTRSMVAGREAGYGACWQLGLKCERWKYVVYKEAKM